MNASGKQYRLRCRCSTDVTVVPGQAGTRLSCPACGALLDVPRLRDLEAAKPPVPIAPPGRWRRSHAWCLGGAAVAATAALAASLLGDGIALGRVLLPDATMIRTAVDSADATTIYKAWMGMRSAGVDRGAIPEEIRVQRAAGVAGQVRGMLWIMAAAAAVVSVAAGIASVVTGGRAAGPAEGPA